MQSVWLFCMTNLAGDQSYKYDQQHLQVTFGASQQYIAQGISMPQLHTWASGGSTDGGELVTMHLSMHGDARMRYPDAGPEPPALKCFHDAIEAVLQPSATDSGLRIHAEKADHGQQCQQPQQVTGTDPSELSRTDTAIWTYVLELYTRKVLLHLSKTIDR